MTIVLRLAREREIDILNPKGRPTNAHSDTIRSTDFRDSNYANEPFSHRGNLRKHNP